MVEFTSTEMPRTYIVINRERVDELRRQGCTWEQIKDDLGVSYYKLETWRSEVEYVEPNRVPEDDESGGPGLVWSKKGRKRVGKGGENEGGEMKRKEEERELGISMDIRTGLDCTVTKIS